jgi:hypothetical protein
MSLAMPARFTWCRSKLPEIAQRSFHRRLLLPGKLAEAAGKFAGVEAGQSLHIPGGNFRQPARLAQRHFPTQTANLQSERCHHHQRPAVVQ